MNFKDTITKMLLKNNNDDLALFRIQMIESVKSYEASCEEYFRGWCNFSDDYPLLSRSIGKRRYLKEKCKALITMDHEQIEAARQLKAALSTNLALYNTQLEATKVSTSVWFTSEPNTPTHY